MILGADCSGMFRVCSRAFKQPPVTRLGTSRVLAKGEVQQELACFVGFDCSAGFAVANPAAPRAINPRDARPKKWGFPKVRSIFF